MDRDPISPSQLVDGYKAWLASNDDSAFEQCLLDQGVMNPNDAIEWIESISDYRNPGVYVGFDDGSVICIDDRGFVREV